MQKATEQENLSEFMAKCMYKHKSVQKNKRAQVKFHKRIVFERIAPSQSRIHKLLRRNPRAKSHYIISCRNRKHIFFSGFFRHIEKRTREIKPKPTHPTGLANLSPRHFAIVLVMCSEIGTVSVKATYILNQIKGAVLKAIAGS